MKHDVVISNVGAEPEVAAAVARRVIAWAGTMAASQRAFAVLGVEIRRASVTVEVEFFDGKPEPDALGAHCRMMTSFGSELAQVARGALNRPVSLPRTAEG